MKFYINFCCWHHIFISSSSLVHLHWFIFIGSFSLVHLHWFIFIGSSSLVHLYDSCQKLLNIHLYRNSLLTLHYLLIMVLLLGMLGQCCKVIMMNHLYLWFLNVWHWWCSLKVSFFIKENFKEEKKQKKKTSRQQKMHSKLSSMAINWLWRHRSFVLAFTSITIHSQLVSKYLAWIPKSCFCIP